MEHVVFIGSSYEHKKYAEAVLFNFNDEGFFPVCWHHGVQKPSQYTLDNLISQLGSSNFGIFILSPDDIVESRNKEYLAPRDNVVFELGMYFGSLGRERTFFLVPNLNNGLPFKIPSDLTGLTYTTYRYEPAKKGMTLHSTVAAACIEIKEQISGLKYKERLQDQIIKSGLFTDFSQDFCELFENATIMKTGFIHSRRWRENHFVEIDSFLKRKNSKWIIYLPDIKNYALIEHLKVHFDDGINMYGKIMDAYIFVKNLVEQYPNHITLYAYELYQTYTFYQFDSKVIVSMYPLSSRRTPTPTFLVDENSILGQFFFSDIELLAKDSHEASAPQLIKIVEDYVKTVNNFQPL